MATNEELAVAIQHGERDKLPILWNQVEKFVRKRAHQRTMLAGDLGGATHEDLYQSGGFDKSHISPEGGDTV